MNTSDVIVVGGGLVGMAVAYGLARQGAKVRVLDEGDDAFRASRGNFGLVWVQGKGYGFAPYTRWTRASAGAWPALAAELNNATGVVREGSRKQVFGALLIAAVAGFLIGRRL